MSKVAIGILIGILIFIVAGIMGKFWLDKMRRDIDLRKPKVAQARVAQAPATSTRFRSPKLLPRNQASPRFQSAG
jgi:hypothetical protein